jgi:ADP-ribose pyrophosphatase YjhB (NUDIX family)
MQPPHDLGACVTATPPVEPGPPPPAHIRVLALAVLLWRDHLLCAEGYDTVKQQTFFRPLGGGVEFGERAEDAAVRELREELGMSVEVREALGVTENLFTYQGRPGHEVVFEYVCVPAPGHAPATLEPLVAVEGDARFVARWLPLAEVLGGAHLVYPDGLVDRLTAWVNRLARSEG